ncbi:hypothetical protein ACFXTO_042114 [Malus domestica]|uniref:Disease resistance R13L4/SHOC-2-like LRR domain-containing protein n=1 Tax=Malus domestica TaxID=3750 RepID=A0A498JMD2_MALDO|nr:hypothetical protein DVH24_024446 [Malus domestica]
MDKLKALIVTKYGFLHAKLGHFQLLGLLPNLKRIRLQHISDPSITRHLVQLKNLRKISLFMCNIGQAFSNCSIPISDAFPNLEEMNIDWCTELRELPADLCNLVQLKTLSITTCHMLRALPVETGKLVNLEVLRLRSCTNLLELPGSIRNLRKLHFLDISDCVGIKSLPEGIGEMISLRKLTMRRCWGLQGLPRSLLDLERYLNVVGGTGSSNFAPL